MFVTVLSLKNKISPFLVIIGGALNTLKPLSAICPVSDVSGVKLELGDPKIPGSAFIIASGLTGGVGTGKNPEFLIFGLLIPVLCSEGTKLILVLPIPKSELGPPEYEYKLGDKFVLLIFSL